MTRRSLLHINGLIIVQISNQSVILNTRDHLHYRCASLKYQLFHKIIMCEMIDEIEIEHLRMALARARKEANPQAEEEKPLTAVA